MIRFLRLIAIVCSLLLTLSLLGCSTNQETSKKSGKVTTNAATETGKKLNTAAVQSVKTDENIPQENTATTQNAVSPKQTSVTNNEKTTTDTSSNNKNQVSSYTVSTKQAPTTKSSAPTTTAAPSTKPIVTTSKPQEPKAAVTLSVKGPKDRGTIIASSSVSIKDDDTIFDIMERALGQKLDASGSGATAYIMGIDNIYASGTKGWVFKLNGESITKSTGVIKVKDGDRIECYYTE